MCEKAILYICMYVYVYQSILYAVEKWMQSAEMVWVRGKH